MSGPHKNTLAPHEHNKQIIKTSLLVFQQVPHSNIQ